MALSLDFSEDGDMHRIFGIFSDAFGDNEPYVDTLFPNHKTPAGREQGAERFLQMKHKDPHARFLKITDTATGEIIGQAKWLEYEKVPEIPKLSGDYWETEEEKQYAVHLHAGFMVTRMDAIKAANGQILCTPSLSQYLLLHAKVPGKRPGYIDRGPQTPTPRCRRQAGEMGH